MLGELIQFHSLSELPDSQVTFGTTLWNPTGTWRSVKPVHVSRFSPCMLGCPAGNPIETFIRQVEEGDVDGALASIREENPFPSVCGRVCFHPCEQMCNRGSMDSPVGIHRLERWIGDRGHWDPGMVEITPNGKTVAIIGSGPSGLAAAYHLRRMGYAVTVFEKDREPGGLLRYGIPAYRLPKNVLDREIKTLREMDITLLTQKPPWQEDLIAQGFDAILFAVGAQRFRDPGLRNQDGEGVWQALTFLKGVVEGKISKIKGKVVVVGGGNAAVDSARSALRLGGDVSVVYRRTEEDMPAFAEEILDARKEGVAFTFQAAPQAISRDKEGRVTGVMFAPTREGKLDASGRHKVIVDSDKSFTVAADTVILATGEDPGDLPWPVALKEDAALCGTDHSHIFVAGDVIGRQRTVAYAIGWGKRAAVAIDGYLQKKKVDFSRIEIPNGAGISMRAYREGLTLPEGDTVPFEEVNDFYFPEVKSPKTKTLPLPERKTTFREVVGGLTRTQAAKEASRCFHCGDCVMCDNCLIFCPDIAITRKGDGTGYEVDLDHCKGCGICARECPRGAIVMVEERL